MAVQVFVSSTWFDLQAERKAVEVVIQSLAETKLIGMEYFGSRDENTQRVSLDEVDRCQIYVGIFGGRYGSGITEDEYQRARELERPCLIYFKHEEQITPDGRDKEPEKAQKLAALKAELEQNHTIPRFSTPDELARMVATDLHRQLGHLTGRKSEELWQNYRQRLSENVGKVRLLGEAESRELQKVFVELSISEEYQRPSARKEYLGFMDAALRERRSLFRSESFGEQEKEKRMLRPEELLRDGTRAVITGAPGCGKSTLLRWLAGKTLTNAHRLPVFLELKSINQKLFDDCRGSLVELLFAQAIAPLLHFEHPSERERLKAEFMARLAKHQTAVFLDGLDEVRNSEFFRPLCDAVNQFVGSEYGRNLLIISTRPYTLDVRFQDANEDAAYSNAIIPSFSGIYSQHSDHISKWVIELLKNDDISVRGRAAIALGKIGGETAVSALIEALQDENSSVRWSTATALRRIGGEAAVPALIEALQDESSSVRSRAATALGWVGGEAAVSALIEVRIALCVGLRQRR